MNRWCRLAGAGLWLSFWAVSARSDSVQSGDAWDIEGVAAVTQEREMDAIPESPGRHPRLSVGAFMLLKSNPYKDVPSRLLVLPSLSYVGRRVQIYGPMGRVTLYDLDGMGLHATVQYRFDGYGARSGTPLAELDDPRDTVEAGLALTARTEEGWVWRTAFAHDVLGRHNGWRGSAGVSYPWRKGPFFVAPEIGITVLSREITRYYYGVREEQETELLSAYEPGSAINMQAELMVGAPVSRHWMITARLGAERLANDIYRSPIVEDRWDWTSFLTISRGFW